LASLDHPNIGAIYGFEDSEGVHALVLQLVEGPTLADRIAQGPMLPDEALPVARQIAEALEAAHEKGIIHRDLKPANVKLTLDGTVKVLDFGLAKLLETERGVASGQTRAYSPEVTQSPTITTPAMTQLGVILGTAAYMSPEQAKGRPADKRSDIWAFGCVLYEMLGTKRTFEGDDVSETLAAVMMRDPDWAILPVTTPPGIRKLLRRCLEKNRKNRLADMADARVEIEEALTAPPRADVAAAAATPAKWTRSVPAVVPLLVVGMLSASVAWLLKPSIGRREVVKYSFALGDHQQFTNPGRHLVAISPDGTRMTYVANFRLYLRSVSELEARPIPGTEDLRGITSPIFSPDSQSIAFFAGTTTGAIKKIAVSGGTAVTICTAANPYGMSWDRDTILFGQENAGIMRVSASGGTPEVVAGAKGTEQAYGPQMLPDGETLLFTLASGRAAARWDTARIVVQRKSGERKTLIARGTDGRSVPTGHLVYALGGTVFAVPFDDRRLEVRGGPVPVLDGVMRSVGNATGATDFSFSNTGSLMYVPGPLSTSTGQILALIDRTAALTRLNLPPGDYEHPRISPDGNRVVFSVDDGKETNVWVYELSGTTSMRRVTFGGNNRFPIWTPDGQRITFQSDREKDLAIWWQRTETSGNAERLTKPVEGTSHVPESWSPRDDQLMYSVATESSATLWAFSLRDKKGERFDGVESRSPVGAVFSPDGRWVSYYATEDGSSAVYVQPFPPTGDKYLISKGSASNGAATHPIWSPDGKELFYIPILGLFEVVAVQTRPTFAVGNPATLPGVAFVRGSLGTASKRNYDMHPDGKRFITVVSPDQQTGNLVVPEIRVIENWFEELKQRVPIK
jgi:serine/threonine-protein kinase